MTPTDDKLVTFHPDPGTGYGVVELNWRKKGYQPDQPITEEAARKVAEGWEAAFAVEAAW